MRLEETVNPLREWFSLTAKFLVVWLLIIPLMFLVPGVAEMVIGWVYKEPNAKKQQSSRH